MRWILDMVWVEVRIGEVDIGYSLGLGEYWLGGYWMIWFGLW